MEMNLKCITAIACITFPVSGFAYDGVLDISTCPVTKYEINNIDTATGWGGHISTSTSSNGYGGVYAECHLTPSSSSVIVLCYDGYLNPAEHVDQFRLDLGPRDRIQSVSYDVMERGIHIKAIKHSTSSYTAEEHNYVVEAFFPVRRESGFCREAQLFYQANGVLSGTISRTGSGYTMTGSY